MTPIILKCAFLLILINVVTSQEISKEFLNEGANEFMDDLSGPDTEKAKLPEKVNHDHKKKGHEHHGHHNHNMGGHEGHMMKMWFHGGFEEVILFDFWRTYSWAGMLLSCTAIFIMGATYEGVKWFRVYLQMNQSAAQYAANKSCVENRSSQSNQTATRNASAHTKILAQPSEPYVIATTRPNPSPLAPPRLIQGLLYVVQLIIAYWLMLIVMTYNTYLTAAVVLGAGFGHWLFAVLQLRNTDGEATDSFQTDACH